MPAMQRRHLLASAAAAAASLSTAGLPLAASAETRPIRLIVPYAAGGPLDATG